MTSPKPPPRMLNSEDEQKIQLFLERAAPVVLQDSALTAERWSILAAIAGDLELTSEQFHATLDDLLSRGVLQRIEVTAPKPPPLPARGPHTASSDQQELVQEEGFALTPPPVTAPPPLPANRGAIEVEAGPDHDTKDSSRSDPPRALPDAPASAGLPPPPIANPMAPPAPPGSNQIGPGREVAAKSRREKVLVEGSDGSSAEKGVARWRVEGEPPPVPPPPPKKPHEIFLDFARPTLAPVEGNIVSEELEQRLMLHGTRVLNLSPVYCQHLLRIVLAEKNLTLASATAADTVSTAPIEEPSADPRVRAFSAAAVPLLALHRGFNPQSRVLLNAIAREHGLSETEMEEAISKLTTGSTAVEGDNAQQERLVPLRAHLNQTLERFARGILPPPLLERLSIAGVELFGVENDLVQQTIRQVAAELKVAVVTQEQAEQYVSELLSDVLGEQVWVTTDQRERIQRTASQWGLTPARIEEMIQARTEANRETRRREQALSRLALSGAAAAVFLVIAFLIYAFMGGRSRDLSLEPDVEQPRPTAPVTSTGMPGSDDSWWGAKLAFSIEQARKAFPNLHTALRDIGASSPERRQVAYRQIIEQFLDRSYEEAQRNLLLEVLTRSLARDPDDACAIEAARELTRIIPDPAGSTPDNPDKLSAMFWSVRAVAGALRDRSINPERAEQLAQLLGEVLGFKVDTSQPPMKVETDCLASLAERLFRMLITSASVHGTNAARLHAAIATHARIYLDPAVLDKLNAEFLLGVLGSSPDSWRQFEELIRRTAISTEGLAVLKMVELFESTRNNELQELLGVLLIERSGSVPFDSTVEGIAQHVRRSLGVTELNDPDGLWRNLSREANRAIEESIAPAESTDRILTEIAKLTHYATLACALAQSEFESAAILDLRKAGPKAPTVSKPEELAKEDTSLDTYLDGGVEGLKPVRDAIAGLQARRPDGRIEQLTSLARLTETIADLPPREASELAKYLLATKSATEHARVLDHVESLAKWNQLCLAIGDSLDSSTLKAPLLQQFATRLLGHDAPSMETAGDREKVRQEIWAKVFSRLPAPKPTVSQEGAADAAARALFALYVQQSKVLGTPLPSTSGRETPSRVLRNLIQDRATRLTGSVSSEAARKELAEIAHELTAVQYASSNDVQATVMLERIWLRLLAMDASARDERHSAEAAQLVRDLALQDRESRHVLKQMRDGQIAILRMWLLIGKRGS